MVTRSNVNKKTGIHDNQPDIGFIPTFAMHYLIFLAIVIVYSYLTSNYYTLSILLLFCAEITSNLGTILYF